MLAAAFPVLKDDADDEVEIVDGFYDRTTSSMNDKGERKVVDNKGKRKAEDEESADKANITGPSSAPLNRYAFERTVFITVCEEVRDIIQQDGQLFDEEEKESVGQLQEIINKFFSRK